MDVVAVTRGLTLDMVEEAYRRGLFPMAEPRLGVVTWHQPDTRAVIPLDGLHVSRSLRRSLRRAGYEVSFDQDFAGVMRGCAEGRPVWISEEFHRVYGQLHRKGGAHSVEVWHAGRLVGGVYGVQVGGLFCAESKFHRMTDASKVALKALVDRLRERDFALLEVQYLTPHLVSLGAVEIPGARYLRLLRTAGRQRRSFAD